MDSFIPILLSSSIRRLSEMWLPIPILLFICVSACCSPIESQKTFKLGCIEGYQRIQILNAHLTLISFAISGVKFICSLIPERAASIVETLNNLNASSTCSCVATRVLIQRSTKSFTSKAQMKNKSFLL